MADDTNGMTILAVQRAADILQLFAESETRYLGVSEIARRLSLSKASAYRLLVSLADRRLVEFDQATELYALGPGVLMLGMTYLDQIEVRSMSRAPMRRLVERSGETAALSVEVDHTRVYVDQITPHREVKMTVQLGRPASLHAGGASKVFLAHMREEEFEQYIQSHKLERYTETTISDLGTLRAELVAIRERGYALSIMERQVSAGSVAAPILDHEGSLVAVMSLCGPVERFQPKSETFARLLMEETRELSARLGYREKPEKEDSEGVR